MGPAGWGTLPGADAPRVRALAWLAIAAQALFTAGWVAGWLLEPGYSPARMYISELGRRGAAHPWIFDVSVVVWGAGSVALGAALAPALRDRPWRRVAPALFVLAGVLTAALAGLRLDCADSVSAACRRAEAAGRLSWHDYGHLWTAFAAQIAVALTPFALARSLWPSRLSRLLLGGAIVVVAGLEAVLLTHDHPGGAGGAWQRVEVAIGQVWVLLCAAALLAEARYGAKKGIET